VTSMDVMPGLETTGVKLSVVEKEPRLPPSLRGIAIRGLLAIRKEADTPIYWVWEQIASRGSVVEFAGPPGGGKTTLQCFVFVGLAAGMSELFGHKLAPVREGKVILYIQREQGPGSICRKLLAACQALGQEPSCLDSMVILARKSVLLGDARWQEIVEMIREGHIEHIGIDTLARFAPADGNDEKEQTDVFDRIVEAIEAGPVDCKPTVWINLHATAKREPTYTVADVMGSTARTGQADTVVLAFPNMEDARIQSVSLYFPKVRDLDAETVAPVTYQWRKVDGKFDLREIEHPKKKQKLGDVNDDDVVAKLREMLNDGEIVNVESLAVGCRGRTATVRAQIHSLVTSGHIIRSIVNREVHLSLPA
jgi:hypothetical protein